MRQPDAGPRPGAGTGCAARRAALARLGRGIAAWLAGAFAGCDQARIDQLEEGVSSEADVRRRFGEPAAIHVDSDGSRTLEYPRQPEGRSNLMITIGPDGMMSALRQVLTEANLARVRPGMGPDEVRRILGQPAARQRYPLAREEVWDWRFRSGAENKLLSVVFSFDGVVLRTAVTLDPRDLYAGG